MINDIEVTPIPVPHDAREPFQFKFNSIFVILNTILGYKNFC